MADVDLTIRPPRPRDGRRNVAFFGLFGVGNYGNEASLEVGLAAARRHDPDASLWCICAGPDRVAAEHDVSTVSMWSTGPLLPSAITASRVVRIALRPLIELARWIEAVRIARRCSTIIVPGTGILDDFGVRPHQMPYAVFRWAMAAKLARTPFAFVGIGAGPIEHRASRWLMRSAADLSVYRSYRDPGSRAFMAAIGSDVSADPVVPDVVFALDRPEPIAGAPRSGTHVGIGLMTYYGWASDPARGEDVFRTYLGKMCDVTERLLGEGHVIRLLIGEAGDQRAVDFLLEALARTATPTDRLIVEPVNSIQDLCRQIQQTDAVVATRFHNVQVALLMERPTVSIGYAEKNTDLMRTMGLDAFCQHIEAFDVERTLTDLKDVMTTQPFLIHKIQEQIAENRRLIDEQFSLVLAAGAR